MYCYNKPNCLVPRLKELLNPEGKKEESTKNRKIHINFTVFLLELPTKLWSALII